MTHPTEVPAYSPSFIPRGQGDVEADARELDYLGLPNCSGEEKGSFLGGVGFTLDLASRYWQVPIAKEDREKTAFVTPIGLYEFLQMTF